MAWGLYFLSRHDTESGHWPILAVLIGGRVGLALRRVVGGRFLGHVSPTMGDGLAWVIPAPCAARGPDPGRSPRRTESPGPRARSARCRFAAVPIDDIERLAVWCREHTPARARFIGPPGPKTFRLWSRRSLAFNRAGSPYHAAGLADWFARFQDHVDVHASPELFVQKYLSGSHEFEARYDAAQRRNSCRAGDPPGGRSCDRACAAVSGSAQDSTSDRHGPLVLLHREGRFAVYRVEPELLSQLQARGARPAPAVTQPVGEDGRVNGGQNLDPRRIPPGLGQGQRAGRIASQLQFRAARDSAGRSGPGNGVPGRVEEFAGTEADEVSRGQHRDRRRQRSATSISSTTKLSGRPDPSVQTDRRREMVLVHVAGQQDTNPPDVVADKFVR